jgi:hypothetical protein
MNADRRLELCCHWPAPEMGSARSWTPRPSTGAGSCGRYPRLAGGQAIQAPTRGPVRGEAVGFRQWPGLVDRLDQAPRQIRTRSSRAFTRPHVRSQATRVQPRTPCFSFLPDPRAGSRGEVIGVAGGAPLSPSAGRHGKFDMPIAPPRPPTLPARLSSSGYSCDAAPRCASARRCQGLGMTWHPRRMDLSERARSPTPGARWRPSTRNRDTMPAHARPAPGAWWQAGEGRCCALVSRRVAQPYWRDRPMPASTSRSR